MTFRSFFAIFCIVFAAFTLSLSANAQGVIVPIICDFRPCRPRPIPQPLPNALPVKSIQLDTKINGQVATTHVEQVFRNVLSGLRARRLFGIHGLSRLDLHPALSLGSIAVY